MKILVCGDSFAITDTEFPGLHWSEKILNSSPNFEVCNLAYGGCSNALIATQLSQGLKLDPDFVILSFTDDGRYELDNDKTALPNDITSEGLSSYIKSRYITNKHEDRISPASLNSLMSCVLGVFSDNFEKIKNYFFICYCLQLLKSKNIPFCFSLGGFEYKQDYSAFLNSNFMENVILDFKDCELLTNLWYHRDKDSINKSNKDRPYFHVKDEKVHLLFANQCLSHIGKVKQ